MKTLKSMRKLLLAMFFTGSFTLSYAQNYSNEPFITVWKTDNPGVSSNNQIRLPIVTNGSTSFDIHWVNVDNASDMGSETGVTGLTTSNPKIITFPNGAGTYRVTITNYNIQENNNAFRFYFGNPGNPADSESADRLKILKVEAWGKVRFRDNHAFNGCANLDVTATDSPTLIQASNMFQNCTSLVGNSSFNSWDLTKLVGTGSGSDVFSVSNMFAGATLFNQPIGSWNVSAITNMANLFNGATSFNQPLADWNTSSVTAMNNMFQGATAFNQPLVTDGNKWDVSKVTSVANMFSGATDFNQSLASWKLNSVTAINSMLANNGMSRENYEATLIGWAANSSIATFTPETNFNVNGRRYLTQEAKDARATLISKGWKFQNDIDEGTLPVTFANLKATLSNGELLIQWQTISEQNNDRFIIQLSKDGENWEEATIVNSKAENGNSDAVIDYQQIIKYSTLQSASMPVLLTLVLVALLFSRRKRLFISMALISGVFLVSCAKSDVTLDEVVPDLYVKITQIDKDGKTTSDSDVVYVKKVK